MRSMLLASAVALSCASLLAQSPVTVPSKGTNTPGNYYSFNVFYGTTSTTTKNEARVQGLYATSDVSAPAAIFKSLAVRRPSQIGNNNAAATLNLTLQMSVTATAHTAASTVFASNHGANLATVFKGQVSLPARGKGTWPEPWETPIAFSQVFPYAQAMGASLVVDTMVDGNSALASWIVEAYQTEYGTSTFDYIPPLATCQHSGGTRPGGYGWNPSGLIPGGTWVYQISGYPNNKATFNSNSLVIGTQGQGGNWGPLPLPFNLSTFGFPSPSGCGWSVDFFTAFPMKYVTSSSTTPNLGRLDVPSGSIVFPNTPAFAGAVFFAQNIALDTDANNVPFIYPSFVSKWTIGTGNKVPVTTVYRTGDNTQATGSLRQSEGATLLLAQ